MTIRASFPHAAFPHVGWEDENLKGAELDKYNTRTFKFFKKILALSQVN